MKKNLALLLALLSVYLAVPAFAQDAGTGDTLSAAPSPILDDPMPFVHVVFNHVKAGEWLGAAAALLVVIVSLLRVYGRKLHDWLPDNQIWDKPLWFLFDTKPGGWLLNLLTALAGGIGTAQVAGEPVTWALLKPILLVSVSGAALWELVKDLMDFFKKKPAPAVAPVEPPKA